MEGIFIPPWLAGGPANPAEAYLKAYSQGSHTGSLQAQAQHQEEALAQQRAMHEMDTVYRLQALQESILQHQQQLKVDEEYKKAHAKYWQDAALQQAELNRIRDAREQALDNFTPKAFNVGGVDMIQNGPRHFIPNPTSMTNAPRTAWMDVGGGKKVPFLWNQHTGAPTFPHMQAEGVVTQRDRQRLMALKSDEAAIRKNLPTDPVTLNFEMRVDPEGYKSATNRLARIIKERKEILANKDNGGDAPFVYDEKSKKIVPREEFDQSADLVPQDEEDYTTDEEY